MIDAMPDVTPAPPNIPPLLWEQHCCLPLSLHADVGQLARYLRPGGSFVSVNVGYTPHGTADALGLLNAFRRRVADDNRYLLAATTRDIDRAHATDRVAVGFDLEDSRPLRGQLDRVQRFYDLRVRAMLPTYNHRNAAGSGCLDAVDEGLTAYGRALAREMNAVGMVIDRSHCRSVSTAPSRNSPDSTPTPPPRPWSSWGCPMSAAHPPSRRPLHRHRTTITTRSDPARS
jgi:hypothetical protein